MEKDNRIRVSNAFSLIELLIVVSIIGILASIALPNLLNAQIRGKIAKAQSDMHAIELALEQYRCDCNCVPPTITDSNLFNFCARLKCLTTPISYLTLLPKDSFVHREIA